MKVACGRASQELGAKIAKKLSAPLIESEFKVFPDGEQYVRLKEEVDEHVVLVQSTPTDSDFLNLLFMLDALRYNEVTAVIPYMGYARQDKEFEKGESISIRALAEVLDPKVTKLITVDVHDEEIKRFFDSVEFENVTAFKELAKELKKKKNQVVVAPDHGAITYAETVAKELGCKYDFLDKKRKSETDVEIKTKEIDVEKKEVILVDDMVSTGGTISTAINVLKNQGAENIKVVITHPVFAMNSIQKIYSAGADEIISTDTIEKSISTVSVADPIIEAIK